MQLSSALTLFLSAASIVSAQLFDNQPDAAAREIDISVIVTLPDGASAEASKRGPDDPVVIVNGILKMVNVTVVNREQESIGIQFIGGSLLDPITGENVRNLTQRVLSIELPKDQKTDIQYGILVDMHPKDLRLQLEMVLRTSEKMLITTTAYDSIVRVVEQPMSLLDPQLYVTNSVRFLRWHPRNVYQLQFSHLGYSFTLFSSRVLQEPAIGGTTTGSTLSIPRRSAAPVTPPSLFKHHPRLAQRLV